MFLIYSHITWSASRVKSYLSRYYTVGDFVGSLSGVGAGYVKGGVYSSTTHLYSNKVDCWIDGDDIFSYHSGDYLSTSNSNKCRS